MKDLKYYKSAVEDMRGLAKAAEEQKREYECAADFARKKVAELEKDLFREDSNEEANHDRMLERILAAIKRLP